MRRWNGWGDEATVVELPAHGAAFLENLVGTGQRLNDATLEQVLMQVPESRLSLRHPLISVDAEVRVRHARGQSLPDWLAMRSGEFGVFPDGVALPETAAQIRELLAWAREQDAIVIASTCEAAADKLGVSSGVVGWRRRWGMPPPAWHRDPACPGARRQGMAERTPKRRAS